MSTQEMRSRIAVLVASCAVVFAAQAATAAPLRTSATAKGLFIGAAVDMSPLRNDAPYSETLRREFNMLVAENAFKFDALHPARTTYNFADADALVAFAEANGMAIRGHTLVWHSQLPGWLSTGTFTRDEVIAIMRDHIMTVVGRYRGRIVAWDVVNEAVDDGGQLRTNSFWFQRIGPEYVAMAFRFAREADPSAILYYNDFEAEGSGPKSDGVFSLVSGLVNQGVPIDGVGWQMHKINPFRISTANRSNAQRLAALGLEISITEMDVRIQLPSDATELQQQALAYGDAVSFCLTEPSCAAVVIWGFTDKYSWIPGFFSGFGDALIFDASFRPKPAYTAMLNVLEPVPDPDPDPDPGPGPGPAPGDVTITPVVAATGPWFNELQLRVAGNATLTALSVTIVMQRTGGVSFSGQYNTVGGAIAQTNSSTATAVTYRFTLAAGQTLGPSTNRTFAAQASGSGTVHPTSGDTFTVTFTAGGQSFTRSGTF
jgi:endo-1,4-beta-xylanase